MTQKQVDALVKEKFKIMQEAFNKIEEELVKDESEFNVAVVALHFGRAQEMYTLIAGLLGIFKHDKKTTIETEVDDERK
jgi:hypothetical protein